MFIMTPLDKHRFLLFFNGVFDKWKQCVGNAVVNHVFADGRLERADMD